MAEDFRVEEQISFGTGAVTGQKGDGLFPLYRVEKRSIDTMHMAREIEGELKSRVSYGGLKDSRAVAVQYVTPTSLRSARPENIVRERFSASLVGYLPRPLTRGNVIGNRFRVVLRDCCSGVEDNIAETFEAAKGGRVPNYFGLQRFGIGGPGTHKIGKALVKREFEKAVALMTSEVSPDEAARGHHGSQGDVEMMVAREIRKHPGEWVRALRAVPVRLRRLYIQAYQAFVFNKTLSRALGGGSDISRYQRGDNWAEVSSDGLRTSYVRGVNDTPGKSITPLVQMVGYAFRDYRSRFDAFAMETLRAEEVEPNQFYVKEMQEVSAEGGFRRPGLAIASSDWETDGGDATLGFTLGRGQYATILLREVTKPLDPIGSGLI